jgi:hypothetical protein
MRGNPKMIIESERQYKANKNPNGAFVAKLNQKPREGNLLDFVFIIKNLKSKQVVYEKILITTYNDYFHFRIAQGNIEWVSLYTVGYWDRLGKKIVEVSATTGKENFILGDNDRSSYL